MIDRAAQPDTVDTAGASFGEALGALERAPTGQGSVVVAAAWRPGGAAPQDVLDAAVVLARADGWGVARAVGDPLDRARPLALVRRLLVACGGVVTASDSVSLATRRLTAETERLAASAPAGCALVVVGDAHLASRACLRVLDGLAASVPRLPAVLALGFAQPRQGFATDADHALRTPSWSVP